MHAFTGQQRAKECSLKIAFSDGTVVKGCLNGAAETLLDGKQKDDV